MQQPVGVVDVVKIRPHLAAHPAVGNGVIGVGVEGDGLSIDYLGDEAAGVGAVVGACAADVGGVGGTGNHDIFLS